jgi:hypothetical protein
MCLVPGHPKMGRCAQALSYVAAVQGVLQANPQAHPFEPLRQWEPDGILWKPSEGFDGHWVEVAQVEEEVCSQGCI